MTFQQWMQAVDDATYRIAGVSIHDLPDCSFRDWYTDEMSPTEAAREALDNAGWDR